MLNLAPEDAHLAPIQTTYHKKAQLQRTIKMEGTLEQMMQPS